MNFKVKVLCLFGNMALFKSFILFILKSVFHQVIYTDVALDPYSSDGHDGIVREDGKIDACDILEITIIFKRKLLIFLKNVF